MIVVQFLSVVAVGYLIGSIPFGVIIGRRFIKEDIRGYGSGKTGATNVLRAAGKKAAALVLFLDAAKGALAVVVAAVIVGRNYLVINDFGLGLLAAQCLAALAAMAGHNWSVFLKFKGGRGVATFFGGLVALSPVVALFGSEVFIIGVGLTRFASLGSIAGAVGAYTVLIPLTLLGGFPLEYLVYTLIGTIVIIIMHHDNIGRLLMGRERKLGEKAEPIDSPSEDSNE
ncbi:MAG: glycerol-3-phosphate 1-O-acyltransferase PlsY [Dehalococcoidales bacterium]|nr:glycerol-3-phosphate 1-O-acyltransferase PlsY [Dehalococcoidales bacterium]